MLMTGARCCILETASSDTTTRESGKQQAGQHMGTAVQRVHNRGDDGCCALSSHLFLSQQQKQEVTQK